MKKLLLLAIPVLFAAACGAASENGSAGAGAGPSSALAPYRPADTSKSAIQAAPATSGAVTSGTGLAQSTTTVPPLPSAQHLELDASVSVQMAHDKFDDGLNSIIGIVTNEHGYLSGSNATATSGALRQGSFTFQVPVDNFQDTINQIKGVGKFLGWNTTSKSHDAEYVDLQARLKSAQLQLAAYNALLGKATSIQDIITIEQQIAEVQQEIEQYQGQLNYLDSVTQYATVTVLLSEKGAAPAPRPVPDQWGFTASLVQVGHNLAAIANGLILVVGTLLPFLLLALVAFATRRRWMPALARQ